MGMKKKAEESWSKMGPWTLFINGPVCWAIILLFVLASGGRNSASQISNPSNFKKDLLSDVLDGAIKEGEVNKLNGIFLPLTNGIYLPLQVNPYGIFLPLKDLFSAFFQRHFSALFLDIPGGIDSLFREKKMF